MSSEPVSLAVPSAAGMRALGRDLAALLRAGDLVILSGGLGAGKTTLTQGIGEGLGVRGPITSPTFVIARVHPPAVRAAAEREAGDGAKTGPAGSPALVHVDAYRLGSALELDDLDLDTDTGTAVTVVEWGDGLAEGLAADRLEITITADAVGDGELTDVAADMPRTVRISPVGQRWEGVKLPVSGVPDRL